MSKKLRIPVIVIAFIALLAAAGYLALPKFDRWTLHQQEDDRVNVAFQGLLDSCFRMRFENPRPADVDAFCEQLFSIWLADEEAAGRIFRKNFSFSDHATDEIRRRMAAGDLLNISPLGKIAVEQDEGFIAFFTEIEKGGQARLRLIHKTRHTPAVPNDYDAMNQEFVRLSKDFVERTRRGSSAISVPPAR